MGAETKIRRRGRKLCARSRLVGARTRLTACRKLAADAEVRGVPFLVSALESTDNKVRSAAAEALWMVASPETAGRSAVAMS